MHPRKIAHVTGLGLMAMPAHYDPALVAAGMTKDAAREYLATVESGLLSLPA